MAMTTDSTVRALARFSPRPSFGVGALAGPEPFARPEPERMSACYSLAPASADPISMHPLSPEETLVASGTVPSACGTATPRSVLDADPSRLVVLATAGGAFTDIVPSSDVPCRPRAPSHRFQADRQLPPRTRFFRVRSRIDPPDQDRPTVLPRGRVNPLCFRERMEGRPETPSVVP